MGAFRIAADTPICRAIVALAAIVLLADRMPAWGTEAKFPRDCLTIAVKLRPQLREEVSVIDLAIEHAHLAAIPRFPIGWHVKIEDPIDDFPTTIFGSATGSLAELTAGELKCLFEIETSIATAPSIHVSGKVVISTGTQERDMVLRPADIRLERRRPK